MMDESEIKLAWAQGDYARATSLTLTQYGFELLGFLRASHREYDDADDAFALLSMRLWQKMPMFEWKCSMRTWTYLLAHHASSDVRRRAAAGRRILSDGAFDADLPEVVANARTATASIYRTEKRNAFAELCLELPEDDRELLLLRVARDLSWREVALVLGSGGGAMDDLQLDREAARLRKRYQVVRAQLRELGRDRGLLR